MTYWQQLQYENDFCDVTLVCDDKRIKAHKLVVQIICIYMQNTLQQSVPSNILSDILHFVSALGHSLLEVLVQCF